ncbi:hypothetical protein ADILRU_0084 [Leifsonia rubra CMS 76R]|nr:hypothetical protein ADILRU_0084 [Leifsonia rubra CMS 76R]
MPQVSQGTHPEPIDGSALGYLSDGHDVLPDEFGYFLAETRGMHPALTSAVSCLSYEDALHAQQLLREHVDAAYLVHSPGLFDSPPHTPVAVTELSAFIRLVEGSVAGA